MEAQPDGWRSRGRVNRDVHRSVDLKIQGELLPMVKLDLVDRLAVYVAGIDADDFKERELSVGGRMLKELAGVERIFRVTAMREYAYKVARIQIGVPIAEKTAVDAKLAQLKRLSIEGPVVVSIDGGDREVYVAVRREAMVKIADVIGDASTRTRGAPKERKYQQRSLGGPA